MASPMTTMASLIEVGGVMFHKSLDQTRINIDARNLRSTEPGDARLVLAENASIFEIDDRPCHRRAAWFRQRIASPAELPSRRPVTASGDRCLRDVRMCPRSGSTD